MSALLIPGQTCWRMARADQFACIIDAADYFKHVKAAMLRAQHRIMLIGWDLDARMTFERGAKTLPGPNQLGAFLYWMLWKRPGLEVYLLKSNLRLLPAFDGIWFGLTPVSLVNQFSSKRMHFAVDGARPTGAVHHQKIVVIDDSVAFCGGIDLTVGRWDTRAHEHDSRRRRTVGRGYGPRHEVRSRLTVRPRAHSASRPGSGGRPRRASRWRRSTPSTPPGPSKLEPTLRDVDVGIARTLPELDGRDEVREVEALNLAAIAAARHTIYLENQYLAARRIVDALAARLKEDDGPEIVIVLPRRGNNPLERGTMDGARHRLIQLLWEADEHRPLGHLLAGDRRRRADLRPLEGDGDRRSAAADRIIESQQPVDGVRQRVRRGHRGDQRVRNTMTSVAQITSVRHQLVSEHLGVSVGDFEGDAANPARS